MTNAELIKALRYCGQERDVIDCADCERRMIENGVDVDCEGRLLRDAADALEAAERLLDLNTKRCEALRKQLREANESYDKRIAELEKSYSWKAYVALEESIEGYKTRIAELEDELRLQLDTRRKETAEIERLKAENLKLQKQNRDCGWNCKQCEYVDKDLQAEEAEQRLMELDRRLYELRSFNAKMKGEDDEQIH